MANPEKDPKHDANPPEKDPSKLDAILPDDLPPAAAELVGDIDNYQKRMEEEWESAKSSYEQKINRIMEEFVVTGQSAAPDPIEEPIKKHSRSDDRLKNLMGQLEAELRTAGQVKPHFPYQTHTRPEAMQLGWNNPARFDWKKFGVIGALVALLAVAGFFLMGTRVQSETLPYTHTLGPVPVKNGIYILDWFRRSLYLHENTAALPIRAVESVPNNTLATGLAISDKTVWTLDGLEKKILAHAATPDHQVTLSIPTPGGKPVGLFYDGVDLWSADQQEKKLYRHRGNDIEDIRDTFPMPEINVTAFAFYNNRLWLMDGKSRLVNVYRLQKPMLQLGSFDLDPFVKGATPTGFAMVGKKIWVVTENPPALIRIPLSRLKKSKTEAF